MTEPTAPSLSPWLTKDEAAAHLRVSRRQIDRLVVAGRLHRYDLEDTAAVRFSRAELDALLTPRGRTADEDAPGTD